MKKNLFIIAIVALLPIFSFASKDSDVSDIIFAENRLGYGTTATEQQTIKKIGLDNWMSQQLNTTQNESPELIALLNQYQTDPLIDTFQKIRQLREQDDKEGIKKFEKELYLNTVQKDNLLAIYSKNQLREKMTWFWFNHLNVYSNKGLDRILYPDYEENVIRKNALGNFKTLLLASLKSPAMLFYLDNVQNTDPNSILNQRNPEKSRGINENYARELLELHTLGQGNGYTQKDIQELARILTGFTFRNDTNELKMQPKFQQLVVTEGLFLFDPRRHDFGDKTFMGHNIKGQGYKEIDQVMDILVSSPYTAKNISKKLAVYFINDSPSEQLVDKMSAVFLQTRSDIPSVLGVLFNSEEFWKQKDKPNKFKMPNEYIYSVIRLVYDTDFINNMKPIFGQLNELGQQPFGHLTPDGYGIKNKDWESSDQISKRFRFSTMFNRKKTPLNTDITIDYDKTYLTIEPLLSKNTKEVLQQAPLNERMGYLLSSPEMIDK